MTDDRAVRLALQAAQYKRERDNLSNRLRDMADVLDAAAEAATLIEPPPYIDGIRTAARIIRDQLDRRPA